MDQKVFEKGMQANALPYEKLEALIDLGIGWADASRGFDLKDHTLSAWRPDATPTQQSVDSLDAMTNYLQDLINNGHEPAEAAAQLQALLEDDGLSEILDQRAAATEKSLAEEIEALKEAGLYEEAIAAGAGVTKPTVKRWQTSKTKPQALPYERLSNLTLAMKKLVEAGLDEETAAVWLQSPIGDNIENIPVEKLPGEPELIFRAIDIVFVQPFKNT